MIKQICILLSFWPGDGIADVQALEACVRNDVRVQVPPRPLILRCEDRPPVKVANFLVADKLVLLLKSISCRNYLYRVRFRPSERILKMQAAICIYLHSKVVTLVRYQSIAKNDCRLVVRTRLTKLIRILLLFKSEYDAL